MVPIDSPWMVSYSTSIDHIVVSVTMRAIWRHRLVSRLANPGDRLVSDFSIRCTRICIHLYIFYNRCMYIVCFSVCLSVNRLISLSIALMDDFLLTMQIGVCRLRDGIFVPSHLAVSTAPKRESHIKHTKAIW